MRFRGREWRGDQIEVAVIDSGINTTDPRLKDSTIEGWRVRVEATGHAQLGADFHDEHGHGTEVATVIQRDAPGAILTGVKVTDSDLQTGPEALAAGIETAFRHGARVINLSLLATDPGRAQLLRDACSLAREHGAWVVCSGHPFGKPSFPAAYPETLAVISHPDCPSGRIFHFDQQQFQEGPFACYRGMFLTHGYSATSEPVYRGSGLATASLSGKLACLLEALPNGHPSEILDALKSQTLCPDPELGFA